MKKYIRGPPLITSCGKTRVRATARTRGFAIQGGIGFYQVIQSVLTCVDKIV